MHRFLVILALLISFSSLAYERSFYKGEDGIHIVTTFQENGRWTLEDFLLNPNTLQEKLFTKYFDSERSAKQYQSQNYMNSFVPLSDEFDTFVTSEVPGQTLWEVKNEWSLDWENKFAEWLQQEFDKDFFVKYQLATDCADVAFALRWIFARINGLPAANTLAGSHIIFSHESVKAKWNALPTHSEWHKDKKFRAALEYLLKNSFTGTLTIDGYPIKINRESFRIGTIHLTGHHTMVISKIDYSGNSAPILKLSSTMPRSVRSLMEEIMLDRDAVDPADGGLLRMRWPIKKEGKWNLVEKNEMPFYSLEQFHPDFLGERDSFSLALIDHLEIPFNPLIIIENATKTLEEMLNARIQIVRNGFLFCLKNDCSEGSNNYEAYSTPSRDKRIGEQFKALDALANELKEFDESLPTYWLNYQKEKLKTIEGVSRTIGKYRNFFTKRLVSYHPEDSIAERWGLDTSSIYSAFVKSFQRILKKRDAKVEASKFCIQNSDCNRESDLWEKHNSYDIDTILKKEFYGTFQFLQKEFPEVVQFMPLGLKDSILRIPAFISEPTETLDKRNGNHIIGYKHLGSVYRLIELKNDFYVKDEEILNLKTGEVIETGLTNSVLLDDLNEKLISFKGKDIFVYDFYTGKVSLKFETNIDFKKISWFSSQIFSISNCSPEDDDYENKDCEVKLYLITKDTLQLLIELEIDPYETYKFYNSELVASEVSKSNFYYDSKNEIIYYAQDNKLLTLDMGKSVHVSSHVVSSPKYFAYSKSPNSLILFDKSIKKECEVHLPEVFEDYKISDDRYLILSSFSTNKSQLYLIDENCKAHQIEKYNIPWISMVNTGKTTYLVAQNFLQAIYEGRIQKINFHSPLSYFLSLTETTARFLNSQMTNFTVYDLKDQSTTLFSTKMAPILCSDLRFGAVKCSNQSVLSINYFKNENDLIKIYQLYQDSKKNTLFTHVITEFNETSPSRYNDRKQNVIKVSSYIVFIPVGDNVILY